ncbi:MAG TPA: phage holin family protein [Mycobacterium sp.]|nr:phage holin family protein [Mycobacterium sp.]HNF04369.1 phage holin family protein [Mycobacterium sp.]HNM93738.1 phage holin family protein [Mycobacterium sp.]HNP12021.1 phage holin family protein [Mycobacterium sp.]
MDPESRPTADAPIGELLSQLSAQTSRLVRDEIRLAQREFQESARHAGKGAGLISAAGLLAVLAVATLIAAAVAGLAVVLPVWAAALIVGVVLLALAGGSALISRREVETVTPAVPETMASVKNDIDEVKGAAHVRG